MLPNDLRPVLPAPWPIIHAALTATGRWRRLDDVTAVQWVGEHRHVLRVAFTCTEGVRSIILKCASRGEAMVHARIEREIPGIVPHVYGCVPLADASERSLIGLLLEDLSTLDMRCASQSDAAGAEQEAVYTEATALLARVHRHFAGNVHDLSELTETATASWDFVGEVPQLLRLLTAVAAIDLDPPTIDEIEAIAEHWTGYLSACVAADSMTLTHGDFHPGNIMHDAAAIRLIDWGTAGLATPEWDLVMCNETQVTRYLEVTNAGAGFRADADAFSRRLRAAVIVRMFKFIHVAIGLVFGDAPVSGDQFLRAIPLYAMRLVDAANRPRYLGASLQASAARR